MIVSYIRRKFSSLWIKSKILILVSVFGLIMVGFYTFYSYMNDKAIILKSIDEKLTAGVYGAYYAAGDALHDRIVDSTSISETEHLDNIKKLSMLSSKLGLKYVYTMIKEGEQVYITSSSATDEELSKKTYSPFYQAYPEASETLLKAFQEKGMYFEEYTDRWGTLRSAFATFTTEKGKVYIIGADYPMTEIYSDLRSSLLENIIAGIIIYIPFLFLTLFVVGRIVKPLHNLAEAGQKISEGDYSVKVEVTSSDESGILAETLNKMVKSVNESLDKLAAEKAGVEKKVEEAIKDSEAQKEYLSHSVEQMLGAMDRFSRGDLTVALNVKKDDLIGRMFQGFNSTVEAFRLMVTKVTEAVHDTASASSQISASTEEMAAGSNEQAHESSEIASSVEEMAKTILDNTKNAEVASATASEAGKKAKQGDEAVGKTIEGMNRIAEVVIKSAIKVKDLGKSSSQIGEIIQVIDDIADQTNLLALNAAIEAARAGEQGRGFAVVADEVRKLAEKTTKATKEISIMINQIQSDTSIAVEAIEQGTREVEEGKALARNAGEALSEIIKGTEKVNEIISQVAKASEQQAVSSEEISKNIEAITTVTQQTSAGIQQIARSAEDLGKLTLNLKDLVGRFHTGNENKISMNLSSHRNSHSPVFNQTH
ncbi:MAG: methyl-accepting chemotaxis protein [Bacillota bacterium]